MPGFYTDYHGLEVNMVKRLSEQVDGTRHRSASTTRASTSRKPEGRLRHERQPDADAVRAARRRRSVRADRRRSPAGVFLNAKWQFNANGMYQAPYGIELAANVFGRQGYPLPDVSGRVVLNAAALDDCSDTTASTSWSRAD